MPFREPSGAPRPVEPQNAELLAVERGRDNHLPVILHGDEPHVEGAIEVGSSESPL